MPKRSAYSPRNALALATAGIFSLAGCLPGPGSAVNGIVKPTGPAVKIGYIGPMTGASSDSGISAANGSKLAIEAINAGGGVNGSPLELIVKDDEGNGDKGVAAARELVAAGVVAVVGPNFSGVAQRVVDEVLKPASIVSISPAATAQALKTQGETGFFFRTVPPDGLQGTILASLLTQRGHDSVLVLGRDNAYGKGLAQEIKTEYEEAAGRKATLFTYGDTAAPDYAAIKAQIPADATAVAVAGYNDDAAAILKAWKTDGGRPELAWFFSESLKNSTFVGLVGATSLEGFEGTFPAAWGTKLSDFAAAYDKSFTGASQKWSAFAYDAVMLEALAMVAGKASTAAAVKANLKAVAAGGDAVDGFGADGFKAASDKLKAGGDLNLEGVSGSLDFSDAGEIKQAKYANWTIKGGAFVDQPTVLRFGFDQ